jgi:hypothetical protein
MVKNAKGGKGAKSMARKNVMDNEISEQIRFADDVLERYAIVLKMYGNGMCLVNTFNEHGHSDFDILCHIRNKFKGRSKRNHFVSNGSIVLIGLREWENPFKNSDLLHVYSSFDIHTLTHHNLISINNNHSSTLLLQPDLFLFSNNNNIITTNNHDSHHISHHSHNPHDDIDIHDI